MDYVVFEQKDVSNVKDDIKQTLHHYTVIMNYDLVNFSVSDHDNHLRGCCDIYYVFKKRKEE